MKFNIRHKLNAGYSIGRIPRISSYFQNERLEGSYVAKSNGSLDRALSGYSIGRIPRISSYFRNERLEGSYVAKSNGSLARALFVYYYWDKKEIIIPPFPAPKKNKNR
jgi:hypothetical protein